MIGIGGPSQQTSFDNVKQLLSSTPVLAVYNTNSPTLIAADASSYGLGAVLRQKEQNGQWRPVAYASRALASTEQRYAQIQREALAVSWPCERFAEYIVGKQTDVQTYHKSLIALLGTKDIDKVTPSLQRLKLRLLRFSYNISHVRGKNLIMAILSIAPIYRSLTKYNMRFHCLRISKFV